MDAFSTISKCVNGVVNTNKDGIGECGLSVLPGLDVSVAGVDDVVHLQVDGGVHDGHDEALLQRQP